MTALNMPWRNLPATQAVMAMLHEGGHQAWFVGGCVRDGLLGIAAQDIDISTDARPERVMALAKAAGLQAVPTGIEHGTVTVIADHHPFEITTFRRDVATDGRRAVVAFADTLDEDALRRDFTMNALYAANTGEILDPTGGLEDLARGDVRFIGVPAARIKEDYLRILRFFRFTAYYSANGPDAEGLAACAELAEGLAQISVERITAELLKLLAAPDPAPAMATMQAAGVLWRVLPGAEASPLSVLVHLEGEAGASPKALRRLAAIGAEPAKQGLRLSKKEQTYLTQMQAALSEATGLAEIAYREGAAFAQDVMLVRAAVMGEAVSAAAEETIATGAGAEFPLKAADVMPQLQGPQISAGLRRAEAAWIISGFALTRADLIEIAINQPEIS